MNTNKSMKKSITALDLFSGGVGFTVRETTGFKTLWGASLSIMCSLLVLAYSLNQLVIMALFRSTNYQMTEFKNYFEPTDVHSGHLN
jgi:hypothetical protein